MAIKSFFSEEMMSAGTLSVDTIFMKLAWFETQFHLLHLQTTSFAEHKCLDTLYSAMSDYRDSISERIMGYTGTRVKASKMNPVSDYSMGKPVQVVRELVDFAKQLEEYAETNGMPDIENISQSLSGDAAKALYLLTLS